MSTTFPIAGAAGPWLRPKAAARYVGASEEKLERLRRAGDGPEFSRVGRIIMYSTASLDRWMASQSTRRRSTEPSPASDRPALRVLA